MLSHIQLRRHPPGLVGHGRSVNHLYSRKEHPPCMGSIILSRSLGFWLWIWESSTASGVSISVPRQAIHDLLAEHTSDDPAQTLVVFETCDCSGWIYDIAVALGFAVAVANPAGDAWRWTKVKRKTDRDDALKLAQMSALNQLPIVHMPDPLQRQKRRLVHHRRVLSQRQTEIKNFIRSIHSQQGIELPSGNKCWSIAGIKQIAENAKPFNECEIDELWRGRLDVELKLLESIHSQLREME